MDPPCGYIYLPADHGGLETRREVRTGKEIWESPANVVVEANLANRLVLRIERKKRKVIRERILSVDKGERKCSEK